MQILPCLIIQIIVSIIAVVMPCLSASLQKDITVVAWIKSQGPTVLLLNFEGVSKLVHCGLYIHLFRWWKHHGVYFACINVNPSTDDVSNTAHTSCRLLYVVIRSSFCINWIKYRDLPHQSGPHFSSQSIRTFTTWLVCFRNTDNALNPTTRRSACSS